MYHSNIHMDIFLGCFYHLTQSTFRKLQALGLVALYKDDEEFRHFSGMLDGLAFLPSENVIEGMDILREVCPQEAEPLLDYFDKTYVNGTRRVVNIRNGNQIIRRTPPLFPIEMWNVHQATMIKDPRTNNIAEGGTNRYKELIGHHHPSIWRSIDALQFEEKSVCLTLVKYNIGEMPAVRVSRHTKRHQK